MVQSSIGRFLQLIFIFLCCKFRNEYLLGHQKGLVMGMGLYLSPLWLFGYKTPFHLFVVLDWITLFFINSSYTLNLNTWLDLINFSKEHIISHPLWVSWGIRSARFEAWEELDDGWVEGTPIHKECFALITRAILGAIPSNTRDVQRACPLVQIDKSCKPLKKTLNNLNKEELWLFLRLLWIKSLLEFTWNSTPSRR